MKLSSTLALASLLFVAAASSLSIVTAAAADPENKVLIDEDGNHSMMPYSPPTTTADEDTHQSKRLELYHRLLKFKNKNGNNKGQLKKSIKVKVPKPNQNKIDGIKNKMKKAVTDGTPLQVGLTEVTSEPIPLVIDNESGVSETCIQSDDAGGINLHLSNLIIPKGVEVIITCPLAESETVYDVNEWTYTCPGDEVCVNIVSKEGSSSSTSGAGDIIGYVTEIGYMVDNTPATPWGVRRRELYGCDFPSCYQDACDASGVPENLYPDAVAGMLYNVDGSWFVCTGSLINNPDNKLYFLTANHCLNSQTVASTLQAYGGGVSDCVHGDTCPGSTYNNGFQTWQTNGATLLETSELTDVTLLELSGSTDPDMKWLGWTLGSVSVGSTLHRLSHPSGRHMTYSTNVVRNRSFNCGTFNSPTNFINTRRSTGSMRGGSSGSAITNDQGQIVGQLLGSCGTCNRTDVTSDCLDCQDVVDGRLAVSYSTLDLGRYLATSTGPSPTSAPTPVPTPGPTSSPVPPPIVAPTGPSPTTAPTLPPSPLTCQSEVIASTIGKESQQRGTCGTSDGSGGGVWYKFYGTGVTTTLTTCAAETNYDTKIRVFTASGTCVGGNDDDSSCPNSSLQSTYTFNSVAGVEYDVLVHGYNTAEGTFKLSLDCATSNPTLSPVTANPTEVPTESPSKEPTKVPSLSPSKSASKGPSSSPTDPDVPPEPTDPPISGSPSFSPSKGPSKAPTDIPTLSPSKQPSSSPTVGPSASPTKEPTSSPSLSPSSSPSKSPSVSPSSSPSSSPVVETESPSKNPTTSPSLSPSQSPSKGPSVSPSVSPTKAPTDSPSSTPTKSPSKAPTLQPTSVPTLSPTPGPTLPPDSCEGISVQVDLLTDDYPSETDWTIVNNCDGSAVASNPQLSAATSYLYEDCLPEAEYTFTITDSYGDGICCGYGSGSVEVIVDGTTSMSSGDFGSSTSTSFGSCGSTSPTKSPTPNPTLSPITANPTDSPSSKPTNSPVSLPPPGTNDEFAVYDSANGAPHCEVVGKSCSSGNLLVGRFGLSGGSEPNSSNTLDDSEDGSSGSYQGDESLDKITVSSLNGGPLMAGELFNIKVDVWAWSTGSSDSADFYYTNDATATPIVWTYLNTLGAGGPDRRTLNLPADLYTPSDPNYGYVLSNGPNQAVRVRFRYSGSECPGGVWNCNNGSYDDIDDLMFTVAPATPVSSTASSPWDNSKPDTPSFKAAAAADIPDDTQVEVTCQGLERNRCNATDDKCYWKNRRKGCRPK